MQVIRTSKLIALLLTGALATAALGGCGADASESTDTASDSGTATSASDSSTSSDSSDSTSDTATFDFSAGLDDNGRWDGVTAADLVTLPSDYASMQIPASEVTATEEQIQGQIDSIASNYSTTAQVTDRAVVDGDTVNIDYVGTIDGVEFDGGNTNGNGTTVTIGVTQYIDDFLEQLIGHTPGETFDVEVTFPDDYGEEGTDTADLNGKDAVFSVTINYISETTTPEVTDEWVAANLQENYGVSTVEELRSAISDAYRQNLVSSYIQIYVTENSTATEIPESIVSYQEDMLLYQYQSYADQFGMELEDMLSMAAGVSTADELFEENREALDSTAKSYLVFQAIAEAEGIEVADEDVESYLASSTGSDSVDLSAYEEQYGMPYLKLVTLMQKVEDFLSDGATIVDDSATADATADDGTAEATESAEATEATEAAATDETAATGDAATATE